MGFLFVFCFGFLGFFVGFCLVGWFLFGVCLGGFFFSLLDLDFQVRLEDVSTDRVF